MKRRLGAVLCILLGAVLIGTGLAGNSAGDVGGVAPTCGVSIGVSVICPTGTISFTETTTGTGAPHPAAWHVHITSSCLDPTTGSAVDQTVNVPDGGTASSGPLELYTTEAKTATCSYTYVEESIPAHVTATFDPVSPQTIPDAGGQTNSGLKVDLTNAFAAPTTPPSSSSAPPSSSAPASTPVAASSSTAAVANTGPHEQVRASVWIGVALCVLGLVLLVAGRTRRRASHSE
jgi:hypothetical protein